MQDDYRADVAVIGAGIMGTAIVTRLIETGHKVLVFDLDTEKVAALEAKGARARPAPWRKRSHGRRFVC